MNSNSSSSDVDLIQRLFQTPQLLEQIKTSEVSELKLQQVLRNQFPAELVRAAFALNDARRRASEKFSRADQMWFDRQGVEQSTPEFVARYKAMRFTNAPQLVYDLCSGIGSDSVALATHAAEVISVDSSQVHGLYTQLNAEVYGVADRIQTKSVDVRGIDLGSHWLHIDPDRRAGINRTIRLEDYEPPLEFLQSLTENAAAGAIKLSPASNFGGKFYDCEIELISLFGECKEATVWFGELAGEHDWRATILPENWTLAANPWDHYPQIDALQKYIYDPNPAIVRSGLIDALVDKLNLKRLDDAEEYLTGSERVRSPAVTPFEVLAELPNNTKEIRKYFRDHPVGDVEIKCRHVPTNAEAMRKKIPLKGIGRVTLFIARLQGKTRAIIAKRVAHDD